MGEHETRERRRAELADGVFGEAIERIAQVGRQLRHRRDVGAHRVTSAIAATSVAAAVVRVACQKRVTRASVSRFVLVFAGNPCGRVAHPSTIGNSLNLPLFSVLKAIWETVLPHRIELWTSSLPMRCSTTELRQQFRWPLRGRPIFLAHDPVRKPVPTFRDHALGAAETATSPPDNARQLERFRAKWTPVRVKKTRQNKELEPLSLIH